MAETNIGLYENSIQDGQPIECYKFTNEGAAYQYTSHCDDVDIQIKSNDLQRTETYFAEYIERQSIKPASKGDSAALTVTVSKDFVIAKMFQGPPPEKPVLLSIYRLHDQDHTKFDTVFTGRVAQASFEDSVCHLTVKMESWLSKEIPNGMRQFTCNNVLFDSKCRLQERDWCVPVFIDRVVGLDIFSTTFKEHADGYFANGFLRFDGHIRQIVEHVGDRIRLKYPFINTPRNDVTVAPGCDQLFKTCAKRFHNTLNFTGCLYVSPANPQKTNVGKGVYWVDSQVVQRDTDGFVGTIQL